MKCPHCGSQNVHIQTIRKDKQSRNTLILLITLLVIIAISVISGNSFGASVLVGAILALPILAVLKVILIIIPAGKETVIVCFDCGKKSRF